MCSHDTQDQSLTVLKSAPKLEHSIVSTHHANMDSPCSIEESCILMNTLMGHVSLAVYSKSKQPVIVKWFYADRVARRTTSKGQRVAENPLQELVWYDFFRSHATVFPTLVTCYEVWRPDGDNTHNSASWSYLTRSQERITTRSSMYAAVLERGDCDLFEYISRHTLSEELVRCLFGHIAYAVFQLHCLGLVHRDVSAENVFLFFETNTVIAKLGDLGNTCYMPNAEAVIEYPPDRPRPGKLAYLHPLESKGLHNAYKADVWSLGILLWTMLHGTLPFDARRPFQSRSFSVLHTQGARALSELVRNSYSKASKFSEEAYDMLQKLLSEEDLRPNIQQVMAHPWLKNVVAFPEVKKSNDLRMAGAGV